MDRDRIPLVKEELYKMLNHEVRCTHCTILFLSISLFECDITGLQDLKKANVLVLANKQDLKGAMTAAEVSKVLNLTSIKSHRWQIQACCALTGDG